MRAARATAHSNIALVKYWGKRPIAANQPADLNLPAVGSLSMTLDSLRTETVVGPSERADEFVLDAATGPAEAARVFRHLDRLWARTGAQAQRPACRVQSRNHFPTAAGLASSASGFAALTLAGARAFDLELELGELSQLARMGSGSAARSLWGGFVRQYRGERPDGSDCVARQLHPASHWPLELLVVHTTRGPKPVGSTEGMERCRETSPYYPAWVATSEQDLLSAELALSDRDLDGLGRVMEHSCLKMHAAMQATRPPLVYWNATTVGVMSELWAARADGLAGYLTIDAGPHVKVLCEPETAAALGPRLAAVAGVEQVERTRPGGDASVEVMT